ncbi:MAG: DUF406 family protein [Succinivibrionaceae bacterium]
MSDCDLIKDTCNECGCNVEIGTVLSESDCVYKGRLNGTLEEVNLKYDYFFKIAKDVDNTVEVLRTDNIEKNQYIVDFVFKFSCSAEKMIFQLKSKAE